MQIIFSYSSRNDILNSNIKNYKPVLRTVVGKNINNQNYISFAANEIFSDEKTYAVININIPRSSSYSYRFVQGFGWENDLLFAYLDDTITVTDIPVIIYYQEL